MSKQFTVITKNGSKWLRPFDVLSNVFNVIYLGSAEPGTVLSEEQVSLIYQVSVNGVWAETTYENCAEENKHGLPARTAYTDAESHDRHISDNPRSPLFSHMSSEHGLTLLDSELDEIARHAAPMTGADYWKRRCEAAERYISESPCDPDITSEQLSAYNAWQKLVKQK